MNVQTSIIIPFRDQMQLLNSCLESYARHCAEERAEFILIDNGSSEESLARLHLPAGLEVRLIHHHAEFNFQTLMNLGASHARGRFLVLLNNDIEFTSQSRGIFAALKKVAEQPDVGAVGPLLYYPDGTLQHAGVVIGMDTYAEHLYRGWTPEQTEELHYTPFHVDREVSAVTAAFLMVEKSKFLSIGGFDERFRVCGGDVDFCLRLRLKGYRNLYLGGHSAIHLESKSRDPGKIPQTDFTESVRSYQSYLAHFGGRDPFYPAPLPLTRDWKRFQRLRGRKSRLSFFAQKRLKKAAEVWMHEPIEVFVSKLVKVLKQLFFEKLPESLRKWLRPSLHFSSFALEETMPVRVVRDFRLNPRPRLNLLIPHLDKAGVFGGISTAVNFLVAYKERFPEYEIRCCLTDGPGTREALIKALSPALRDRMKDVPVEIVEVHNRDESHLLVHSEDLFIATAWWTCYTAQAAQPRRPFFYLIQDYEPGFYAWSDRFAACLTTYSMNFIPVFNSSILKEYFRSKEILSKHQLDQSGVFEPMLDPRFTPAVRRSRTDRKVLFFYGRPSVSRNLFGTGISALSRAIETGVFDGCEWVFYSGGEPHPEVHLPKGQKLLPLGKMSMEEYIQFVGTIDVGLSLMLSPHPSYPPLEIAATGGVCVTNTYENKNLSELHPNIISCPPTVEAISDSLREAVARSTQTLDLGWQETGTLEPFDFVLGWFHRHVAALRSETSNKASAQPLPMSDDLFSD